MAVKAVTASTTVGIGKSAGWTRTIVLALVTLIALSPILVIFGLALRPRLYSDVTGPTLETFVYVIRNTDILVWLKNSLIVSVIASCLALFVAAPAGYVLSRARGGAVSLYSMLIFIIQSFPIVVFIIPLFIMLSRLGLVDTLAGVSIIYVASSVSVACWMMAAYFDGIPTDLEEAAWIDGCSMFGAFLRIVLPNSLPGILSTAIYGFLVAWNDYLVALVFLRTDSRFTLPVGLQTFFQQNQTDWGPVMACAVIMLAPPVIIFALLNRFFSIGGIGGSLAGR
ncbi:MULTISPECIES: carbohydrate ABC transporter permease [unclassified Rhizobium]|jgi:multiple sugar transport system permease protein|uniref:carbohydrate ABC transporter permease n=1 Tax=unclassified Rhizobium TaxID=2613769 RepID=UPI0006459C91|nr:MULTISPECIES: carbohydrate ABC transporter permease [unclassified Rhizobium]OJY74469.1 MAG: ABC transporter permease [Rhizobium sp. 60-20]RKD67930.1 carbohydrate ABC transporter membrane protein 2 (CUT1 family) [Rhizobium sp. WW_1]